MSNGEQIVQVEVSRNGSANYGTPPSDSLTAKKAKSRWRMRLSRAVKENGANGLAAQPDCREIKMEISNNERSDLLKKVIFTGFLGPDKGKPQGRGEPAEVMANLTTKELVWATQSLSMADIVAVSYADGTRRFTVHSYPFTRKSWVYTKVCRKRKDSHFLAPTPEDASKWVAAFASLGCFVNCSQHPLSSSKRQGSVVDARDSPPGISESCRRPPRVMLVVLNPRSGRGCARKVYDTKVEPILKLAGFRLKVVETIGPHHAHKLAANVDLSTCTDGIVCVGGDGIVNEVLNGLLSREDTKQSRAIPIAIIPAGSDNSLIWTIMGIRDPISAAISIVKGDLIPMDIFAVEWTKTGDLHMGLTVAYYGFMSDVLELSEKYQKRFGPFRYFVAGTLKFLCLSSYECELEYLPARDHEEVIERREVYSEISPHNHDEHSIVMDGKGDVDISSRMASNGLLNNDLPLGGKVSCDHDLLTGSMDASMEPSEYVRGLCVKEKRVPSMRVPAQAGIEEVLSVNHSAGATTPSPRPRTRSKSKIDRARSGLRSLWDCSVMVNTELQPGTTDIVAKPRRGSPESSLDMKEQSDGKNELSSKHGLLGYEDEKWIVRQGPFLGVMICNHQCKTVQCLKSQVLAPSAEHDDSSLDLVMVHGGGRFHLLRFFISMQFGRHLRLPFVEYTKVRSVKLKPGNNSHKGCGIDGELLTLNGPISTYVLPEQCQLIGYPVRHG